ncbi:MAG: hypothetical protein NC339_03960 [Muribaculaceae bacterium]|nr:hypothetical protein [Muribaculaceae bacterium]
MSKYTGKSVTISRPVAEIYAKVSDLGQYRPMVEQLPAEQRANLQGVEFTNDSISMDAPGVGRLEFKITERREPSHVGLSAVSSPVPLKISVDLADAGADNTKVTPSVDIEIPAMLRPFIGGKIQQAADKFGEIFTTIFH